MSERRYPYVVVDAAPEEAEALSSLLFDLGAGGVEERDSTTLVPGAPGKVSLVASFATHEDAEAALEALGHPLARIEEVVGDGWRDEYKKYFHPFVLCPGIVVCPPWERCEPAPGQRVVEIEPGQAFGTGLHETTSLVASVLASFAHEVSGADVLDVGSGSGILGLVALALGARSVRAIDNDDEAVRATRENAERNNVALEVDGTSIEALSGTFAVVVANLEATVLAAMVSALSLRVAPGGLLVLSGLLLEQGASIRAAYTGFELVESPERGEWTALVLRASR
jgi:ribosomal protein L11 methyltransferase